MDSESKTSCACCHVNNVDLNSPFICRHLLNIDTKQVGFIDNTNISDCNQAWCYKCEEIWEKEGSITAEFKKFHGASIVCYTCYQKIEEYHRIKAN